MIFGEKYVEAEKYLAERPWIAEALRLAPEETRIALSVVFPELIRFSYLQDRIQIRALKVLYVQYGRKYANFSVGHFQMKPSFIEQIEADWNRLSSAEEKAAVGIATFDTGDTSEARKNRVLRLDEMRWQVDYLRLFMAVMGKGMGMSFSAVSRTACASMPLPITRGMRPGWKNSGEECRRAIFTWSCFRRSGPIIMPTWPFTFSGCRMECKAGFLTDLHEQS